MVISYDSIRVNWPEMPLNLMVYSWVWDQGHHREHHFCFLPRFTSVDCEGWSPRFTSVDCEGWGGGLACALIVETSFPDSSPIKWPTEVDFYRIERFPWSIYDRCCMPAGSAYPSNHLVPSPIVGLACAPIVETRFLELAVSLVDFSPWIPLGTFSILLCVWLTSKPDIVLTLCVVVGTWLKTLKKSLTLFMWESFFLKMSWPRRGLMVIFYIVTDIECLSFLCYL